MEGELILLDGGLATQLEARGHDLSSALWSARLVADAPEAIVGAHRAYFEAGAQVATTASYQAPLQLIAASVKLAQRAQEEHGSGTVAGSLGPYGASLADGSEYRGDYELSVAALRRWHRPRIAALVGAGVDILAAETIPCLAEAEALVAELAAAGVPAWLSVSCTGDRLRSGESAVEAFGLARGVDSIVAVGVNCTAPDDATTLVAPAAAAADKPVVVYPNSGESWDARLRTWSGEAAFDPDLVRRWVGDGATWIGGCCRVGPAEIAVLGRLLSTLAP